MESNKMKQIIADIIIANIIIGASAAFCLVNGFVLMVNHTLHGYKIYCFVRGAEYAFLVIFIISTVFGIKIWYQHGRGLYKLRYLLVMGISFLISCMVIGLIYGFLGIA